MDVDVDKNEREVYRKKRLPKERRGFLYPRITRVTGIQQCISTWKISVIVLMKMQRVGGVEVVERG